jgi:hypothetical protein
MRRRIGDPEDAAKGTRPPRKVAQQPKHVRPVFRIVAAAFRFDRRQSIPQRFRVPVELECLRGTPVVDLVSVVDAAELEIETHRIDLTNRLRNVHN